MERPSGEIACKANARCMPWICRPGVPRCPRVRGVNLSAGGQTVPLRCPDCRSVTTAWGQGLTRSRLFLDSWLSAKPLVFATARIVGGCLLHGLWSHSMCANRGWPCGDHRPHVGRSDPRPFAPSWRSVGAPRRSLRRRWRPSSWQAPSGEASKGPRLQSPR